MICELREKYSLDILLKIAGVSRSTFYYELKHMDDKISKDAPILKAIEDIFNSNNRKYGYPRITIELHRRGYREIDYIKIDTGHGDYLCADVMEKKVEGDNE